MHSVMRIGILAMVAATGCHNTDPVLPGEPKQIIDLSPTLTEESTCAQLGSRTCEFLGVPSRLAFTPVVPLNPRQSFGMTRLTILTHSGAHVDAPGRLLRDGARANQLPLNRFFGRVRVWDLRWHDRNTPLQINDLGQQPAVEPGDILLLLTGYSPPSPGDWPPRTWLSAQAASWLAARPIRALGTDLPSLSSFEQCARMLEQDRQPEEVWAERVPLLEAGIPIIEGLINLEQLLDKPTVMFAGFPLAVADRSGAPMRAVALVY